MATFAIVLCHACNGERMSRVSEVIFQGRLVRTTQCWQCGTARVERFLSTREAVQRLTDLRRG